MESHSELLSIAKAETGLDDFGSDSFLEGFEILVNSLRNEAQLNAMGDVVIRGRIIMHLKQRLQIEDWYRRHPEINDVLITAPLIGLSLPRTGSTALSFLLAEDPNARSLRRWEASEPCPPPSTVQGADPRINEEDIAALRANGFKPHTPSGEMAPAECQDLMALDFKSQIFLAFAQIPSYAYWLLDADLTSTYEYQLRAMKVLQWGFPDKPWRLKCPTHLIYLEHLNKVFPDARFVMTHRDPADVMLSVIDVYYDIASKFSDHVDMSYMADLNIKQWSEGMRRALEFRDRGNNDSRFYDIHFRTMHKDPIGEVRGLYQWLNEPVSDAFAAGMNTWWQDNSASREPSTKKVAADYGVDLDQMRPLFAEYTRRMTAWTSRESL